MSRVFVEIDDLQSEVFVGGQAGNIIGLAQLLNQQNFLLSVPVVVGAGGPALLAGGNNALTNLASQSAAAIGYAIDVA